MTKQFTSTSSFSRRDILNFSSSSSCVHLFSKSALFRCSLSNAPLASPKRALKLSSSGRTSYKNLFLLNIFAIHLFHLTFALTYWAMCELFTRSWSWVLLCSSSVLESLLPRLRNSSSRAFALSIEFNKSVSFFLTL